MRELLQVRIIKELLQLTLTSQKIIFEKEKGLFKKERELIDILPLDSVKVYNDATQVKQKGDTVEVQTVSKNLSIVFSGMLDARKFTAKIVRCSNWNFNCSPWLK